MAVSPSRHLGPARLGDLLSVQGGDINSQVGSRVPPSNRLPPSAYASDGRYDSYIIEVAAPLGSLRIHGLVSYLVDSGARLENDW